LLTWLSAIWQWCSPCAPAAWLMNNAPPFGLVSCMFRGLTLWTEVIIYILVSKYRWLHSIPYTRVQPQRTPCQQGWCWCVAAVTLTVWQQQSPVHCVTLQQTSLHSNEQSSVASQMYCGQECSLLKTVPGCCTAHTYSNEHDTISTNHSQSHSTCVFGGLLKTVLFFSEYWCIQGIRGFGDNALYRSMFYITLWYTFLCCLTKPVNQPRSQKQKIVKIHREACIDWMLSLSPTTVSKHYNPV